MSNLRIKYSITIALLVVAAIITYGSPRERYHGSGILNKIHLPEQAGAWTAHDVPPNTVNLQTKMTTFINEYQTVKYVRSNGTTIYLTILDAGNFHNPKVCFTTSGYEALDLQDTVFHLDLRPFIVPTVFFKKNSDQVLLIYWLNIDQQQVSWAKQKLQDLWYSLLNKPRVGVIVRLDIPTKEENIKTTIAMAKDLASALYKSLTTEERNYIFGK